MLVAFVAVAMVPILVAQQRSAPTIGWVRDSTGAPIGDADVSVPAMRLLVHTDSTGAFTLRGLDAGAVTLNVRHLGYTPQSLNFQVRPASADSLIIALRAIPQVLDALRVGSARVHHDFLIEEFYRRQALGSGAFITRADIEARNPTRLSDVVRQLPGIRVVRGSGGTTGIRFPSTSMARRDCPPQYWVDGRRVANFELDEMPPRDIEGIELYHGPSTTPMQFTMDDIKACGTVVLWSRPPGEP
jgi:hypothetical protein